MGSELSTSNAVPKLVLAAIPKLVEVLAPLSAEDRRRAISAAMIIFGDSPSSTIGGTRRITEHLEASGGISGKAITWMEKNSITHEQLEHCFSIEDDSVDVIAARMPSNSKRQQTVEAYIMCGLKSFLKAGELTFTDAEGRELCDKFGCYDIPNHSNYTKAFGNFITGSKDAGWKLTNPGLSEAAKIVKLLLPKPAT